MAASAEHWQNITQTFKSVGDGGKFQPAELRGGYAIQADLDWAIEDSIDGKAARQFIATALDDLPLKDRRRLISALTLAFDSTTTIEWNTARRDMPFELPQAFVDLLLQSHKPRPAPQSYMSELFQGRPFEVPSPFGDGGVVAATGSIPFLTGPVQRPLIYYYFGGEEPFYLSSDHSGALRTAYFPKRKLQITFPPLRQTPFGLAELRACLIEQGDLIYRYLSRQGKGVGLLCNSISHLGDQGFNETEAVAQLIAESARPGLEAVIQGRARYFDLFKIFPELAELPRCEARTSSELLNLLIDRNVIVLAPSLSRHLISKALGDRFAAGVMAEERTMQSATLTSGGSQPTLWFEVRSNDRIWRDQIEGYAAIANAVAEDYGGAVVMVAGWSVLDGKTELLETERRLVEADREVAAQIRAKLSSRVTQVDIIGETSVRKLRASQEIDAYVSVFSSGLIFPSAFARRPGVILYSRSYKPQIQMKVIEAAPQWVLIQEPAATLEGRILEAPTPHSFDADWREILAALRAILNDVRVKAARAFPV